ncbi:MAG: DUF4397 domain-containing protein [Planctomycetota bacterium]
MNSKAPVALCALSLSLICVVGCGNNERSRATATQGTSSSSTATPSTQAATAKVRVLHASPDAPAVDVLVDDAVALAGVPYKAGSGYLDVPAGARNLKVNAAGTTTTVIDVTPTLDADGVYTAIAVGPLSAIEPLLLVDDASDPAPGDVRLRVVHGSPTAGQVDVYVTAPGDDLSGATPTLAGVSFKDASGFLDVPAGDYRARLTPAGQPTVVYDSGAVSLAPGSNLTLVAVDTAAGFSPVSLVALTGDSNTPTLELVDQVARLRVVHASPDAPAVDALVNGAVVAAGVTYRQASGYLDALAGQTRVQVNPANSSTSVIDASLAVLPGTESTVIAVGRVSQIGALVLEDDTTPPAAGNVKLRLVHGSPSAGPVDIYVTAPAASLAGATPTLTNVTFLQASGYLEVPAGDYRVRITVAGSLAVAIDTGALTLGAGQIRTAIAVDPAPRSNAFGAILLADR